MLIIQSPATTACQQVISGPADLNAGSSATWVVDRAATITAKGASMSKRPSVLKTGTNGVKRELTQNENHNSHDRNICGDRSPPRTRDLG